MDARESAAYERLVEAGAEKAVQAFLNFHGTQLLTTEFCIHLVDDGLALESDFPDIYPDPEEDDEDIEDDFAEGGDE